MGLFEIYITQETYKGGLTMARMTRNPFRKIRGFFIRKILAGFGGKNRAYTFDQNTGDWHINEISFYRYVWKIFPLYNLKYLKRVPLTALFNGHITNFSHHVMGHINFFYRDFCKTAIGVFKNSIAKRTGESRAELLHSTDERFQALLADGWNDAVKQASGEYRKELFAKLDTTAKDVFVSKTQQHLVSLLLKVREDVSTSGSTAMITGANALPYGTRFAFQRGKNTAVYVVEQPPQAHTVSFSRITEAGTFTLAFPFVIFFVAVKDQKCYGLQVFFRNKPLETLSDAMCCPALPNINGFWVCFPRPEIKGSATQVVEATIQNFWGSIFNADYTGYFDGARSSIPEISSLKEWAQRSKQNPYFGLSLHWQSANRSVGQVAEEAMMKMLEDSGHPQKSDRDILHGLEGYVRELGGTLGQNVQEACLFLGPRWHIDEPKIAVLQEQFNRAVIETETLVQERLVSDIEALFRNEEIERVTKNATQKVLAGVKKELGDTLEITPVIMSALTDES
jgi:hypothetical protein